MAPNLQGLNLLLQPSQTSQDLLSEHPYPDLASLWTSINFDSEESPVLENNYPPSQKDEEEAERLKSAKNAAIHDGHVNVVTGTAIPNVQPSHQLPPNFDLSALLSGEYSQMFQQQQHQQPQQAISPSLAQLLMFNAQNHISAPPSTPKERDDDQDQEPPAKRARTRKSSVSLSVSSPSEIDPQLSPTEDKRRRNTAASARFRMKKKEREAALEGKAKELETRVSELERECEGLRRENGWLKGLVVGVTGAAQGASATAATTTAGKRPREVEA